MRLGNDLMLKIAVLGAGRMARRILEVIEDTNSCESHSVWVRDADKIDSFRKSIGNTDVHVASDLSVALAGADIAIDFTLAAANSTVVEHIVAAKMPLVCGVSGLDDRQTRALLATASSIPLLYDRNMSYGIAVLERLLRHAGAALRVGYDTEIHEVHHRHKQDSPSGTALLLGETLAESRGQEFADVYRYPVDGDLTAGDDSIAFFVTREGETPGDHKVVFRSDGEIIELSHSVADRRVFAEGAVRAAVWLADRPAGLYRMSDVLAD